MFAWTLALATLVAMPQGLRISHTAPTLGTEFLVKFDGAQPHQRVVLFHSPRPADLSTAWGRLAIDPAEAAAVAEVSSDSKGSGGFSLSLPLAEDLAECPAYFQAIELPSPLGRPVLSNGLGVRLLGPRLFLGAYREGGGFPDSDHEVLVYSSVSNELLFREGLGFSADRDHDVVVSANGASAAFMGQAGIQIMDNFFLGKPTVLVPVVSLSSRLFCSSTGTSLFALVLDGASTVVREYDFQTGALLQSMVLPPELSFPHAWAVSDDGLRAYVAAPSSGLSGGLVGELDLLSGQVEHVVAVSGRQNLSRMRMSESSRRVLVAMVNESTVDMSYVEFSSSPPEASLVRSGPEQGLVLVDLGDEAFTWRGGFDSSPFRGQFLPLGDRQLAPRRSRPLRPMRGSTEVRLSDWSVAGDQVWFIDPCCNEPGAPLDSGAVYRLDVATGHWAWIWSGFPGGGPHAIAAMSDGFGTRIAVGLGDSSGTEPLEIFMIDQVTKRALSVEVPDTQTLQPSPGFFQAVSR